MLKVVNRLKILKPKEVIHYLFSYFKYFNNFRYMMKEYNHLKNLIKNTKRKQLINKSIVFNTVKSIRHFIDREMFIGKVLALNGAKVMILLDNGLLMHHEPNFKSRSKKYKNLIYFIFHKYLIRKALKIYKGQNLEIIYYNKILKNVNYTNWQELKKYAFSSTIRYFQTSELDFNKKEVKIFFNLSLKNAVLSRNVGEYILNNIKPDFFITSHGIYSTWGPAYDFLKKKGIRSLLQTRSHSHSDDTRDIYFTSAKAQTLSRCNFWQNYKNVLITKEMEQKVKEWFNLRSMHKTKDTLIYYKDHGKLYKVDKNDGYKYHIAIFPSLIWDGNIKDRHIAFDGIIDWLISTIDYLKNKKDIKLFIKFHPAEVTSFKNSAKIQDLIQNYLKSKKIENLILIPTEYNIDPYKFLKSGIDLGICYDGIIALEMPIMKIPVLLGGVGGRFSVEGGNFTIKSRKDYFNYLENLDEVINDFHMHYEKYLKNIIRYSYWYIFENVIKLSTISRKNQYKIDLLQLRKEDLQLNEKLYKIFN